VAIVLTIFLFHNISVKAQFHYTDGLNRSPTRFELSRHVEIARTCLWQVGNQVCDQVCDVDSIMESGLNGTNGSLTRRLRTSYCFKGVSRTVAKEEAYLLQRDRATLCVSWILLHNCTKNLIRAMHDVEDRSRSSEIVWFDRSLVTKTSILRHFPDITTLSYIWLAYDFELVLKISIRQLKLRSRVLSDSCTLSAVNCAIIFSRDVRPWPWPWRPWPWPWRFRPWPWPWPCNSGLGLVWPYKASAIINVTAVTSCRLIHNITC